MNLNDLKISYKIAGGFAIVLVLGIIISIVGYTSMQTVVDRVDKADDANRLVNDVLKARQQEKNFELRGYTLYGSDTEHAIQKLNKIIEEIHLQITKTKAKFNNVDNIMQIDSLSKELEKYENSINKFENIYNGQEEANALMVEKARIVEEKINELKKHQKEQINEHFGTDESAEKQKARFERYNNVELLISQMAELKVAEKNYMIKQDKKYADVWYGLIDDTFETSNKVRSEMFNEISLAKINLILNELKEYKTAGEKYIELHHESMTEEEVVVSVAKEFENIADELRTDQKDEMLSAQISANVMIISFAIIAIILGAIIAFFITKAITKPINKVVKVLDSNDLNQRCDIHQKDEVGKIGESVDNMLENVALPVKEMADKANKIAEGDMTVSLDVKAEGDVGRLVENFKRMISSMTKLITKVKKQALAAASSSEELSASSEEVNASMEQVASTIQEVAKGAQDTSRGAVQAQAASKKTGESAQAGSKSAQQVNEKMGVISATTKEGADRIKALGEKSQEIGKIVDTINNISEQTNLLALNAAIEAARAGEYGRGFAVVADEVRKLAEESGKATGQISDLISGIQGEIESSVQSMDKNTKQVDEGGVAVQKAVKSFEAIPELVENVNKSLNEMGAVAQENAAGAEEVSSSIEEVTSSMQQVSSSAQNLSQGAEELKQLVSKFKVSGSETSKEPSHETEKPEEKPKEDPSQKPATEKKA